MLTIDPAHRLIEGVASDGKTVWVSSVLDRQILVCRSTCQTLATIPGDLSPIGLAWDWSRDLIWVAADCPELAGGPKCTSGALVALSPRGKIVATLAVQGFHPGSVSVSRLALFVSDSRNGLVYALLPRRSGLRRINRRGDGTGARGAALSPDGASVIVADYSRGIVEVDLRTGTTIPLPRVSGGVLKGVDGLVRCGEGYFGVQNGSAPGHILSIAIHAGKIDAHEIPRGWGIDDPTQIAFDGKRLLVISNSGWEVVKKPGSRQTDSAHVVEIPLMNGCNS